MIYSGVDLIRKAESTNLKAEKFAGPRAVAEVDPAQADGQKPDQQGTLLRFARFLNTERRKKSVSKPGKHPYAKAFRHVKQADDLGQMLDVFV